MNRALLIGARGNKDFVGPLVPVGDGTWRCTPEKDFNGSVVLKTYVKDSPDPILTALFSSVISFEGVEFAQASIDGKFDGLVNVTLERVK